MIATHIYTTAPHVFYAQRSGGGECKIERQPNRLVFARHRCEEHNLTIHWALRPL